jgi:hypothetical protein
MERIRPPQQQAVLVRDCVPNEVKWTVLLFSVSYVILDELILDWLSLWAGCVRHLSKYWEISDTFSSSQQIWGLSAASQARSGQRGWCGSRICCAQQSKFGLDFYSQQLFEHNLEQILNHFKFNIQMYSSTALVKHKIDFVSVCARTNFLLWYFCASCDGSEYSRLNFTYHPKLCSLCNSQGWNYLQKSCMINGVKKLCWKQIISKTVTERKTGSDQSKRTVQDTASCWFSLVWSFFLLCWSSKMSWFWSDRWVYCFQQVKKQEWVLIGYLSMLS